MTCRARSRKSARRTISSFVTAWTTGTRSAPDARDARNSGAELVTDANGPTTSEVAQAETSLAGKLRVRDAHNPVAARHQCSGGIDGEHGAAWRERLPLRDVQRRRARTEQFY